MHIGGALRSFGGAHKNDAIGADAEMTIAKPGNLGRGQLDLVRKIVHEDKVVASSVKFGE